MSEFSLGCSKDYPAPSPSPNLNTGEEESIMGLLLFPLSFSQLLPLAFQIQNEKFESMLMTAGIRPVKYAPRHDVAN